MSLVLQVAIVHLHSSLVGNVAIHHLFELMSSCISEQWRNWAVLMLDMSYIRIRLSYISERRDSMSYTMSLVRQLNLLSMWATLTYSHDFYQCHATCILSMPPCSISCDYINFSHYIPLGSISCQFWPCHATYMDLWTCRRTRRWRRKWTRKWPRKWARLILLMYELVWTLHLLYGHCTCWIMHETYIMRLVWTLFLLDHETYMDLYVVWSWNALYVVSGIYLVYVCSNGIYICLYAGNNANINKTKNLAPPLPCATCSPGNMLASWQVLCRAGFRS